MPYVHGEAFCLMWYRCDRCGRMERIWNSRDGVTPFAISCPECKPTSIRRGAGMMQHVQWCLDECRPDYQPKLGERFFRDGTPDEARAIMRARLEKCRGTEYELPESEWDEVIERAATATDGEFQPGWPQIEVAS